MDAHADVWAASVTHSSDPVGWRLEYRASDGAMMAEATVGEPVDGIGVLWWIGVEPRHRGIGLSRRVLDEAIS